jgi:hypothetical protein
MNNLPSKPAWADHGQIFDMQADADLTFFKAHKRMSL